MRVVLQRSFPWAVVAVVATGCSAPAPPDPDASVAVDATWTLDAPITFDGADGARASANDARTAIDAADAAVSHDATGEPDDAADATQGADGADVTDAAGLAETGVSFDALASFDGRDALETDAHETDGLASNDVVVAPHDASIARDAPDDASVPMDAGPSCPAGMALVPAGTFLMGDPSADDAPSQPVHGVRLSAYCIDLTEVTVAAYAGCPAAGCTVPNTGGACNQGVSGRDDHPVNCVDWNQARAFCQARGADLPTEAQWEYAARGSDGRLFPWGTDAPAEQLCWSGGATRRTTTCPVRSYPSGTSPFGLYDMAGNVWEWTLDWYGGYTGDTTSWAGDPTGVPSGISHVDRGGAWGNTLAIDARSTIRFGGQPARRLDSLGFRCASAAPVASGPVDGGIADASIGLDARDAADGSSATDAASAADTTPTAAETAAFGTLMSDVRSAMASSGVPGASVAVVLHGRLAFAGAAGLRNIAGNSPVTTGTLFRASSMSKMVLAATAMSLVRDGRLDLHAPITRYLPWFALAAGYDASTVTLEHLLTHTSGFPCDTINQCIGTARGARQDFFATYPQPLWAPPGAVFDYSNTGYSLAATVLTGAAGVTDGEYEQLVHDRVFVPAGMTTATYDITAAMQGDYATGYTVNSAGTVIAANNPANYDCPLMHASGGVTATPSDYAHFVEALFAGGGTMIDPAGVSAMESSHVSMHTLASVGYGYGLITQFLPYAAHASVWHDGDSPGYMSVVWMVPDRQFAIVVMINGRTPRTVTTDIVANAEQLFLNDPRISLPTTTPSSTWDAYAGTYNDTVGTLGAGVVVSLTGSAGARVLQVDAPNARDLTGHATPVHGPMTQYAIDSWLLPDGTGATFFPAATTGFGYVVTRRGVASR